MPKPSRRSSDRLDAAVSQLRQLQASDPDAARRLALELVATRAHRVLEPALEVLRESPSLEIRPALHARFFDLTEHGTRADQDCSLRITIVRILRTVQSPDNVDLALAGLRTVQLMPPGIDVAQALRAESLLLLSDIDPDQADYYAVNLLDDPHMSKFSFEPVITALSLLGAGQQHLAIWTFVRRPGLPVEVLTQAFADLKAIPKDLQLEALMRRLNAANAAKDEGDQDEAVALFVAETIIQNDLPAGFPVVIDLLPATKNLDLYRYITFLAARANNRSLREILAQMRETETDATKRELLSEP